MTEEVVVADGLWKGYGDREVLRDVRFTLRSGEAVGYLGPNGAGKTTTLKLLAGISRPTRGSVRVHGLDPVEDRGAALRRLGALVETPGVPPYLHGADLLEYVARVKGVPANERRGAARRAAGAMGVEGHMDRAFGTLSTGLSRRLLLAATLIGEPDLLLLDEPTLGLDPAARHDLRVVLRGLARNGLTLLLSTHLLEDVEAVCGRVLFLRDGVLVGDEPLDSAGLEARPTAGRALRLRFSSDVSQASIAGALGGGYSVVLEASREATVRFPGGDDEQRELLARLIEAGLPLVAASPPEPDLARRYFERVGREDSA